MQNHDYDSDNRNSSDVTAITVIENVGGFQNGTTAFASVVDEVELVTVGANQLSEPWCTDDVCSAALKDLAETCKGIFDMKRKAVAEQQSQNENQRAMVENYITGVLGAPFAMVSFLSVGDVWNNAYGWKKPEKVEPTKRIQNRASVPNSQAIRFQRLKNEMTFEAAEGREKLHYLQTVNSFDDLHDFRKRNERHQASTTNDLSATSTMFQHMVANILQPQPKDAQVDNILYYDSDPEDIRESTLRIGPRRAKAKRMNAVAGDGLKARRRTLDGVPIKVLGASSRSLKKMDDLLVADIIEVSSFFKPFSLSQPPINNFF